MIELTLAAQQRLDSYLAELRRVLTDDAKSDPVDVERDIRDHIQTALAEADGPVDASRLDQVLRSLGAPAEWIEHPDRPWFARSSDQRTDSKKQSSDENVQRAAGVREGYILPALSLLTLVLGLMLALLAGGTGTGLAIIAVAVLGAFVLARAAMTRHPDEWQSPGQKWLLSPSLMMVYVPLMMAIIMWPVIPGYFLIRHSYLSSQAQMLDNQKQLKILSEQKKQLEYANQHNITTPSFPNVTPSDKYDADITRLQQGIDQFHSTWIGNVLPGLVVCGVGILAWWVALYIASKRKLNFLRTVFAPYSPQFVRRVLLIALMTFLVAILVLA